MSRQPQQLQLHLQPWPGPCSREDRDLAATDPGAKRANGATA